MKEPQCKQERKADKPARTEGEQEEMKEHEGLGMDEITAKLAEFQKQLIEKNDAVDEIWWEGSTGVHIFSKKAMEPWKKPINIMHRAFNKMIQPVLVDEDLLENNRGEVSVDAFLRETELQIKELIGENLLPVLMDNIKKLIKKKGSD